MKFFKTIFLVVLLQQQMFASGAYLWESTCDNGHSCCLFFNGADICNPHVPCTRNVALDLQGISDYIGRILQVDKSNTFSYCKVLTQAQDFIKNIMHSSVRLYYRFDTAQRRVKFYHDIAEAARVQEKNNKGSATTTASAVEKQKNEDAILAYMIKLGLAWKK